MAAFEVLAYLAVGAAASLAFLAGWLSINDAAVLTVLLLTSLIVLSWIHFGRADAIICISEASRQDLLRFYAVDPAKTRVIHQGVTRLERSPETAAELRPAFSSRVCALRWLAQAVQEFPRIAACFS